MKNAPKRTLITNGFNSRLYLKVIKETAACGAESWKKGSARQRGFLLKGCEDGFRGETRRNFTFQRFRIMFDGKLYSVFPYCVETEKIPSTMRIVVCN